ERGEERRGGEEWSRGETERETERERERDREKERERQRERERERKWTGEMCNEKSISHDWLLLPRLQEHLSTPCNMKITNQPGWRTCYLPDMTPYFPPCYICVCVCACVCVSVCVCLCVCVRVRSCRADDCSQNHTFPSQCSGCRGYFVQLFQHVASSV